jgi:hypothetical protein
LLLSQVQCGEEETCAQTKWKEDFLQSIGCQSDFEHLKGAPLSRKFAQVEAVKLVYDIQSNQLYFINHASYQFHFDFCSRYLKYSDDLDAFNISEYGQSGERHYFLANINHYLASDRYTLEFLPGDAITSGQVGMLFNLVSSKVCFREKLYLLPHASGDKMPGVDPDRIITVDKIFGSQQYQPMVLERSFGYLRRVKKEVFEHHSFGVQDIIITDFLPNDLPFCQGIMTSAFQTPLAHINILSHNRKTPNCAYKQAWDDPQIRELEGKLVYYQVQLDTFYIREADLEEAKTHWDFLQKKQLKKLSCNLTERRLLTVGDIDRNSVAIVGAKAANFGELEKIQLPDGSKIPVPEGAFAIPFFYYQQHIKRHGIQKQIDEILSSDSIKYSRSLLDQRLHALRDSIKSKPVDPGLIHSVAQMLLSCDGYSNFRFRSSTNAEDIEGFSGAGLYSSKTGSLSRKDKPIEDAIRKVWASLWNLRAFEERVHAQIDQSNLAMGILVHRAFGTEEANGVAITRNLYRSNYPACTVNIQKGEHSVVLPTDQATPEQFLLKYKQANSDSRDIAIEYISHASLNDYKPLLQPDEYQQLAAYLYAVKKHFYYASGQVILGPEFNNFAMDVEFKLDKGSRKIYLKQARPY